MSRDPFGYHYPAGADTPDAPWNQPDVEEPEPKWFRMKVEFFDVLAADADEAIELVNSLHKKHKFISIDGAVEAVEDD